LNGSLFFLNRVWNGKSFVIANTIFGDVCEKVLEGTVKTAFFRKFADGIKMLKMII